MNPMPSWRRMLAAALLALAALPAAGAAPSEAVVNVAGRQRMLSQRIVKAWCQIGIGVLPRASRIQLDEAIALFERQMVALDSAAHDSGTRAALRSLAEAWRPFKAIATGPVSNGRARLLREHDGRVLAAAQALTERIEAAAGGQAGGLVNLAGRQRMLSQRLAKVYMLRALGQNDSALDSEAAAARNDFESALASLKASARNTGEILGELDAVELQWRWFGNALSLAGTHAYKLVVADASESIVNSMDRITELYEAIGP